MYLFLQAAICWIFFVPPAVSPMYSTATARGIWVVDADS